MLCRHGPLSMECDAACPVLISASLPKKQAYSFQENEMLSYTE